MTAEHLHEDDRPVRRLDEVLHALVDPLVEPLHGRRRRRLEDAEDALRRCVEVNAGRILTLPELRLVELEVQLDPVGAAARIATAPALLRALPRFLDDADWEGEDDEDRRVRIRLALELLEATDGLPEFPADEVDAQRNAVLAAWRRARWRLRRDQHERRLAETDPAQRAWLQIELDSLDALSKPQDP
ncbi:hypothetical protein [Amnibacterium kyonggiense]|uniref:YD repeat-containing protein n=1 Tax=Amnibacterium kyonggiense TaxID=595671 RepID=A0A4R7FLF2_9MICO|nr:hypothetical protein [Amnibacterium kyonggiense]TDS77199.1 YD repeat-containing protein [Amnibacterium kyonggiense]